MTIGGRREIKFFMKKSSLFVAIAIYVTASLATTAFAETCDKFDELIATTPSPPNDAAHWRLFAQEFATSTQVNDDLLLIGDSLVEFWPDTSLSPLRVANFGVGGDQTQHVLWRLSAPKLQKLMPRKVLIVIGTNNLTANSPPCAIIAGITKIIQTAKKIWPSAGLVFLEIPPRGVGFVFKNDERQEVNAAIRKIGGVKTINADDVLTCGWHDPCANYNDDKIHFSQVGYQLLGQTMKSALFQN